MPVLALSCVQLYLLYLYSPSATTSSCTLILATAASGALLLATTFSGVLLYF
jgi:hypothetical protein